MWLSSNVVDPPGEPPLLTEWLRRLVGGEEVSTALLVVVVGGVGGWVCPGEGRWGGVTECLVKWFTVCTSVTMNIFMYLVVMSLFSDNDKFAGSVIPCHFWCHREDSSCCASEDCAIHTHTHTHTTTTSTHTVTFATLSFTVVCTTGD